MDDRTPPAKPLSVSAAAPKRRYVRWVWLVAGLVLLVRLALVPLIATPWIWADEGVYASCAYQIAHHFEFSARLKAVQPYPPGYSLALVPASYLGSPRLIYRGMLVTNCLLVSLVGVVAFYLGRRFLGERDAFLASAVIAVLPSVSVYPYVLMSENLFLPLVMVSCLLVVRACESPTPLAWLWVGLTMGVMALTRGLGLLAVPAALVVVLIEWARRREWLYGMAALGALLAGLWLVQGPWLAIKALQEAGPATLSGYHEEAYWANLKQFLTEWPVFKVCLRLGLHQWLGVGLASAGVFLLFALDLCWRPSKPVSRSFTMLAIYFVLLSAGVTLAALMHMWRSYFLWEDERYALIMRYTDPLVPVVVLFGTVGLVRLREGRAGRTARVRLGAGALGGVAVFLFAFPMDGHKFPNVLSVWYVEPMHEFLDPTAGPVGAAAEGRRPSLGDRLGLPPWVDLRRMAMAVAAVAFLAPFILRRRFLDGRHALWTAGFLLFLNVPLVLQQVRVSRGAERMNAIPKWLGDHAASGEALYFDEGDYYRSKGMTLFYATCFWNPHLRITRYRREVAALEPDYVISWDRFDGFAEVKAAGDGPDRRYLYNAKGARAAQVILDDPRYFDVGGLRLPPSSLENAWEIEEQSWVWTKDRTRFRFQYRLPDGPWVLALSAGGPRPRYDWARLRILLDGYLLRHPNLKEEDRQKGLTHTKRPGNAVWRFDVPAGKAAPGDEHVLEIQTNTFVPDKALTDNPDPRELGIQVFWFKIEGQQPPR